MAGRRSERSEIGQGLVEFALILPVLLLLMWGVIEFGRLFLIYTEVSNSAREAVRYGIARGTDLAGSPRYLDCSGIMQAGEDSTALTPLSSDNFTIAYDHGGGSTFAECGDTNPDVAFGDRLVITVSYSLSPLILFQDAGPFEVQFTAARTIIQQGLPMDEPGEGGGEGGEGDGPPGEVSDLSTSMVDPYVCQVQLTWSEVEGATSYNIYREGVGLAVSVTSPPHPATGGITVMNGDIFYVRAVNAEGEGPISNKVTISGCGALQTPQNLHFEVAVPATCEGYFAWDAVTGADGYKVYDADGNPLATVTNPRYPETGNLTTSNGVQIYVRAYQGEVDGPLASTTVTSCTPAAPTGLTFVLDQASPPCQGHFTWQSAIGANSYRVYQNGGLAAEVGGLRYPAVSGSAPVANGDQVAVSAVSATAGEGPQSSPVTVSGCSVPSEPVAITYYLHSNPTPPVWHSNAPPPLTMNETGPAHPNLYNYNSTDPAKPGREIAKGGGTPPGEMDPTDYLAWRSGTLARSLTLQSNVTIYLWGKNPANQVLITTVYLYDFDGSTYRYLGQGTYQFNKLVINWQPLTITVGGGATVAAGHQLVVWLISDGAKSLQFAYDTTVYPSRIQFTGVWGS